MSKATIEWGDGSRTAIGPAPLLGLTLADLSQHRFPERHPILMRGDAVVFREGHLGEVHGERGHGKSWLLETLALIVAGASEALGFRATRPARVLYVDGEMASREIQDRVTLLCERLRISTSVPLTIVAADWQDGFLSRLDTIDGQDAIEPFVDAADLIILDNRSCLLSTEGEKDATAWQPTQDWLLSLRRRGKAVLLGHHSNRMGGARGHSKAEDVMDLIVKLTRPDDYQQDQGARFVVTFDKCRGAYGAGVAPFLAHLTADGWNTASTEGQQAASAADRILDYLRLAHAADERPKSANAAISRAHIGRNAGLAAWAELVKARIICKHPDGGWYVP